MLTPDFYCTEYTMPLILSCSPKARDILRLGSNNTYLTYALCLHNEYAREPFVSWEDSCWLSRSPFNMASCCSSDQMLRRKVFFSLSMWYASSKILVFLFQFSSYFLNFFLICFLWSLGKHVWLPGGLYIICKSSGTIIYVNICTCKNSIT